MMANVCASCGRISPGLTCMNCGWANTPPPASAPPPARSPSPRTPSNVGRVAKEKIAKNPKESLDALIVLAGVIFGAVVYINSTTQVGFGLLIVPLVTGVVAYALRAVIKIVAVIAIILFVIYSLFNHKAAASPDATSGVDK